MTTEEKVQSPQPTRRATLFGAMFLMATSAIGPGFITQTTTFTAKLGAAMAFAILVSVLVDIAIQMNVWRVVGVSGRRAQDLGNQVAPGAGYLLAALDVFGGVVFNIGNVAGCALGLNALLGLDFKIGGTISAAFAIGLFLIRRAGVAMDRIVIVLGILMIVMTVYVVIVSEPPFGDALVQTLAPEEVDFLVITTLIGGTVGGYIVYAGAHRMIESGVQGAEHVREITRSAITGILITALMRVLLFLAVLGVVAGGVKLAAANPAPSAFEHAGTRVAYLKPHGALYNAIVHDERQAEAVVDAVLDFDPGLPALGLPGSAWLHLAAEAGLPTLHEVFADRAYTPDGTLVSRRDPGAVLDDPFEVADRCVRMVTEGEMVAIDGTVLPIRPDSICVHGDTRGEVHLARAVRAALDRAGIRMAPAAAVLN